MALSDYKEVLDDNASQIANLVCQCSLFTLGLFLHHKIYHVYNVERSKTWLIHTSHAMIISIHWLVRIPFQTVTYFVPNLSSVIGSWICYFGAFITFLGYQEGMAYSLWIAIEKYVLIVHHQKVRLFGEEKLEKLFLRLSIGYPLVLSIIAMITANYDVRAEVKSCFGMDNHTLQSNNTTSSGSAFSCDVTYYSEISVILSYFIHFLCASRIALNCVVVTNLPEAFFYYQTFKFMKR